MSPTATITGSPETGSDARLSGVGHATSTTPPRAIKASNTTATRTRITTPTSRDDCTRFRRTCHAVFGPGRTTCRIACNSDRRERSWSPGQGRGPPSRHGSQRASRRLHRGRHPKPTTHLPPDQERHVSAGVRRGGGDASGGMRRRGVEAFRPYAGDLTADVFGRGGTSGDGTDAPRGPVRLTWDRRRRNCCGSAPSRLGDRAIRGREHTDLAPPTIARGRPDPDAGLCRRPQL